MIVYKLTSVLGLTYNNTRWSDGVEHTASGEGSLCGPGWLHAYEDPRIAVLLNPIHGGFNHPYILWEADGDVGIRDDDFKLGCTRLKTIRKLEPPKITMIQKQHFAIASAKQAFLGGWNPKPVCSLWNEWAARWISGEDRSGKAAFEIIDKCYSLLDDRNNTVLEKMTRSALVAAATAVSGGFNDCISTVREFSVASAAFWAQEVLSLRCELVDKFKGVFGILKVPESSKCVLRYGEKEMEITTKQPPAFDIYAALEAAGIGLPRQYR